MSTAVVSQEVDPILRSQLDDDQYAVAKIADRNVLVLAPPGSGKTRVLVNVAAHRVRHASGLVGRRGRVMCLTFANEAAREIRRRLSAPPLFVPSARLWVGNYHALGVHLLRRYGHHLGWPRDAALLPTPANHSVVKEAAQDLGLRVNVPNVASAISALKGRRSVKDKDADADSLQRLRERYDALLRERRLRDFDDLILHTLDLLRTFPQIHQLLHDVYPFVCVDELQDTNLLQLDLLGELIGPDTKVFGVADDDQMIYGWRDAHPGNLAEFVNRFKAVELPLRGNYRCPPRIVAAANAVIICNKRRKMLLMESRVKDRQGEVLIGKENGPYAQAHRVTGEVERAVAEGVPPGQIAILAPVRFLFDEVIEALGQRGLRYVTPGSGQFAERRVIAVLRLALRGVAGSVIELSDVRELSLQGPPEENLATIRETVKLSATGSVRGLLNRLLEGFQLGTTRRPAIDADNILTLATMMRRVIDEDQPSSPAELASTVLLEWDRLEAAALQAERAVKIMTSFTAKGTEYEVVILPFLNHGLVPYEKRGQTIDWEEARRIFYVALTRAQQRVVLLRDALKPDSHLLELVLNHATGTVPT